MDCLRLRATDAELIKNRLTLLSRRTMRSERNPTALLFCARKKNSKGNRQNNDREKENKLSIRTQTQRQKVAQWDKYDFLL